MIEIIAGIYAGSFALTWWVALTYFYRKLKPQFSSKSYQVLEANLNKINMSWSNQNSDFVPHNPDCLESDKNSAFKSFFLITTLCSLLSFLGFLLLFLVLMTGKSRKERLVFASPLAQKQDLAVSEILKLVEDIKASL